MPLWVPKATQPKRLSTQVGIIRVACIGKVSGLTGHRQSRGSAGILPDPSVGARPSLRGKYPGRQVPMVIVVVEVVPHPGLHHGVQRPLSSLIPPRYLVYHPPTNQEGEFSPLHRERKGN